MVETISWDHELRKAIVKDKSLTTNHAYTYVKKQLRWLPLLNLNV